MREFGFGCMILAVGLVILAGAGMGTIAIWQNVRVYVAEYTVKTERLTGEAEYVRAEQNRRILVEQARAEKDAAVLRAEAIEIVGQAAKDFPEYRLQEFLGAFGEALQSDAVDKIIFVPTEANIPVTEAGRTVD
jgi:regulator of protease activity HflC (stomatin/prohibitin superfamily)